MNGFAVPGVATYPQYPDSQKTLAVRVAGLEGYHDRLHWSWLTGLTMKIAYQMGDLELATLIKTTLSHWVHRDQSVREIYDAKRSYLPFEKPLFLSETEFSWGAAMILDALNII